MGCINTIISRIGAALYAVVIKCNERIFVSVTKIGSSLNVSTSLVCTRSLDNGTEIWWSKDWKVLFDNGVTIKWEDISNG